jgi:hypothetical protein
METKSRRRWLQFSLKGLLILTLVVASFFGGRASMQTKVKDADFRAKVAEMEEKATRDANREFIRRLELLSPTSIEGANLPPGDDGQPQPDARP